jgi:hypothetical protein
LPRPLNLQTSSICGGFLKEKRENMVKWEYNVVGCMEIDGGLSNKKPSHFSDEEWSRNLHVDRLNQLGADGWELIIYFGKYEENTVAIFKRPKN